MGFQSWLNLLLFVLKWAQTSNVYAYIMLISRVGYIVCTSYVARGQLRQVSSNHLRQAFLGYFVKSNPYNRSGMIRICRIPKKLGLNQSTTGIFNWQIIYFHGVCFPHPCKFSRMIAVETTDDPESFKNQDASRPGNLSQGWAA